MAAAALEGAPVLSTPDTHLFEDPTPPIDAAKLSHEQIALTYEIERTVREIREGQWKRIALQFPDHMLCDAPRVFEHLARGLKARRRQNGSGAEKQRLDTTTTTTAAEEQLSADLEKTTLQEDHDGADADEKLFILGDSSYGACCVDEVAAEHVDADVVVHYGRSCLSPPSRLPVIYVFTARELDVDAAVSTFQDTYPEKDKKVVLMADIPFSHHIPALHQRLRDAGYTNLFATEILHQPASPLPNRSVPHDVVGSEDALREYALFHVSDPPTALLLALSSRVASIHIYPTTTTPASPSGPTASLASTAKALNRRYALLTSLSTTPIFGILINTLSVKNYMHILAHVQRQIAAAGKKCYTFVVGKVNAAKVANFSEIGGWVVIGCWESSLIESSDFWKPMITPWELGLALQGDAERVWTGAWEPDFQRVLDDTGKHEGEKNKENKEKNVEQEATLRNREKEAGQMHDEDVDEDESEPPEFDLRTGRYVSHARPMRSTATKAVAAAAAGSTTDSSAPSATSSALAKRATGDITAVGGVASPGAEYLRSNRTWQGLGSDYRDGEDQEGAEHGANRAAKMEEGRSGVARGYVVGGEDTRH
ncbi:Diphthamide biosynthesis protein 2 [Exserohilum turcicum]|uniref:2-(3-amino-3-carboxypropyl)histidine synthase subunit 2 n=1 Tax=Exserohilum turcicum (strain 28A) TaxID=671987 RepID=R0KG97_EXST2|nr:uncharacterized protein SETTUDRAFT_133773 [Exserohilum turcica Et28A]EOA91878.1 hypothetical protein SETTUDRAFT_133773 [Exserohilum turcica Et28A]